MADNDQTKGKSKEDKIKPGDEAGLIDGAVKRDNNTQNNFDGSTKKVKTAQKSGTLPKKTKAKRNASEKINSSSDAASKEESTEEIDESQLGVLTDSLLSTGEDMSKLLIATNSLAYRLKDVTGSYTELVNNYDKLIKKKDKHLLYLMASSVAIIIISLAIVGVMSYSFSKQVNNMNALSMSLTKRITEVNSGLVTFEELNASIRGLDDSTLKLAQEIEIQQKAVQDIAIKTENNTRGQIEQLKLFFTEQMGSIGQTVTALQKEIQNQQKYVIQNYDAVQGMQSELEVMDQSMAQLITLRSSVDALVVLERERYLEAIQSKSEETVQSDKGDDGVISFYKTQN